MNPISGNSSVARPIFTNSAALQKSGTAVAASNVKDADGDHDGTRPGQVDGKDLGKGLKIDRMA